MNERELIVISFFRENDSVIVAGDVIEVDGDVIEVDELTFPVTIPYCL